jgi:hypothetical protein
MKRCPQCMRNVPDEATKCPSCGVTFPSTSDLHDDTEPGIATPAGTLIDSERQETVASTHTEATAHETHQEEVTERPSDDVFTNDRIESSESLTAVDSRVLREIDGAKSIEDIVRISGIRKVAVDRSIETLIERGLVILDGRIPRSAHQVTMIDPPKRHSSS